jgi:hypothetical protein
MIRLKKHEQNLEQAERSLMTARAILQKERQELDRLLPGWDDHWTGRVTAIDGTRRKKMYV